VSVRNSSDSDEKIGALQSALALQVAQMQRNPLTALLNTSVFSEERAGDRPETTKNTIKSFCPFSG
jgi:hypothetical protein